MHDERLNKILEDLERDSVDKYMRICYGVLIAGPKEMLDHSADLDLKLKGINKLIHYFQEREEYEKCTELQKLKEML
jgi:hypothetical protein